MNIGIDARTVTRERFGVGFYTYWLVNGLNSVDRSNNYYIFTIKNSMEQADFNKNFLLCSTNVKVDSHPSTEIWENVFLYSKLKNRGIDLFHGPAFRVPAVIPKKTKVVITVHDLLPFLFPEVMPRKFSFYMRIMIKLAVAKADKIIVVSEATKNDLLKCFKIESDRIKVIYESMGYQFKLLNKQECQSIIKKRFKIEKDYILFVSRLEPRKNVVRLIKAFNLMKKRKDICLVIVGAKSWHSNDIYYTSRESDAKENIIFLDYINTGELVYLYNGAMLFALPSLYEGFGLPVIEAMACGCPVVTSNISSLPEVAGDAAKLINPYNVEEITGAMDQIFESKALREDMIRKGFEQIKKFSWIETARQTLDLYKELI